MIDTDIEGLGPKEATEYVLAFITTLKQTEKAVAAAQEDVSLWTRRVALAADTRSEEMVAQAQQRLAEAIQKKRSLDGQLVELRTKVAILKERLARVRMTGGRSVDVDLLLAQLTTAVGPKDTLSQAMKETETKAALDELKKKMGS